MKELDLKFHRLDGRFKGNDIFTWMCTTIIKPQYERFSPRPLAQTDLAKIIKFNQLRDWCWDTWGPSCDLKDYDRIHNDNKKQNIYCVKVELEIENEDKLRDLIKQYL